jgi:hypothetical protein
MLHSGARRKNAGVSTTVGIGFIRQWRSHWQNSYLQVRIYRFLLSGLSLAPKLKLCEDGDMLPGSRNPDIIRYSQ